MADATVALSHFSLVYHTSYLEGHNEMIRLVRIYMGLTDIGHPLDGQCYMWPRAEKHVIDNTTLFTLNNQTQ
jgi:hypothetical protein